MLNYDYLNKIKMNNFKILTLVLILILTKNVFGQKYQENYLSGHNYNIDIIDSDEFKDLRKREKGHKVASLMTFIPFNVQDANIDLLNNVEVEVDTDHRLTEQLTPNYKKYITDKNVIGLGIYYKRISENLNGKLDPDQNQDDLNIKKFKSKGQGIYLRPSFDHHYSSVRFKTFDLDFYSGASLSLGFMPLKDINHQSNESGDYINITTKSKKIGLGADAYGGINFQFDRMSLGAELLFFGVDYNFGFGETQVIEETSFDGQTSSTEYIQRGDSRYSELSNNRSLTSMYRGVRLQISYYIF